MFKTLVFALVHETATVVALLWVGIEAATLRVGSC